jgi:phosphopantothenoylcysteine decarboxylase/phosphopantothenate--cysteine ligase
MSKPAPLVVVATGSSASIVLPSYLEEIKSRIDADLTVVLTASALRFVQPEVVGWFASTVIVPDQPGVNPIEVALHARAVTVLPASANTVAATALGLMPTTATTIVAASPRPCLFFPQMHEVIWRKPLTERHLAALGDAGHVVVGPQLAAGYEISRGETTQGWSMPGPEDAAETIATWIEAGVSCLA